MAKRYEELTIEDDFMFGKVMEDRELCRDMQSIRFRIFVWKTGNCV